MTKAHQMLMVFSTKFKITAELVDEIAKNIDPKCHIQRYLYTNYRRILFSDGSIAIFSNDKNLNIVVNRRI